MNAQDRIPALQTLGYDHAEAGFLSIAALHSGYFLRRQFLSFTGGTKGWKDVLLLNKLKANGHCRVTAYRHNRMVYHLSAKPLYEALGEKDNRNRRERQPSTIKNKLMCLDFVLDHPAYQYLQPKRKSWTISLTGSTSHEKISRRGGINRHTLRFSLRRMGLCRRQGCAAGHVT